MSEQLNILMIGLALGFMLGHCLAVVIWVPSKL